jgi:two-component system CheB/CheR fusion protein
MPGPTQPKLPDLSGLSVLVVDDDADALEVLSTFLSACGAHVLFARSASSGLTYLETAPRLDAVITDLSMPGMDGVEFVGKIRQHPTASRRRIPVIALTGFEKDYLQTEAFDAYLRKPVDLDRLCDIIQLVLARHRNPD